MIGTLSEYADRLGVAPSSITYRVKLGLLDAAKVNPEAKRFLIDFEKADSILRNRDRQKLRKPYVKRKSNIYYNSCYHCGKIQIHSRRKQWACSDDCFKANYTIKRGGVAYCVNCGKRRRLRDRQLADRVAKSRGNPEINKLCYSCMKVNIYDAEKAKRKKQFKKGGVCTVCGKYYKRKDMRKSKNLCKKCDYKKARAYIKKNPDKAKAYGKKYREKIKDRRRAKRKADCKNLTDEYIRKLLARYSPLKESEFAPEMIELKRSEIMLFRALNERGVVNYRGNVNQQL